MNGNRSTRENVVDHTSPMSMRANNHGEVPEALVDGVKNMAVESKLPDLNEHPNTAMDDKVSGLDSFMDSSGTSESVKPDPLEKEHLSMLERLHLAKILKTREPADKRTGAGLHGAAKDIGKTKCNKKILHANIAASINELEQNGLNREGQQMKEDSNALATPGDKKVMKEEESPAKRSKRSPTHATPLTGAHAEPRHEK